MLPDLSVDEEELAFLGAALGGCDFTGEAQRSFLACTEDCDVQAAPGSGKTTLLVAKLDLLARRWSHPQAGVCVLSHTNTARREVEERLRDREAASVLLSYPHYIGTITTFLHRFLALPYLRGLGMMVRQVDDDAFADAALRRAAANSTLRSWKAVTSRRGGGWLFDNIVGNLTYDKAQGLVRLPRMPGPDSETGKALANLKAQLSKEGVFRYDDLTAFAARSLDECPNLAACLSVRFPLVFLDEAQDTGGGHLRLLEQVFRGRSVIQRLGDANQTIYGGGDAGSPWLPAEGDYIDLGTSWRFGKGIADFASRLTCKRDQVIVGAREEEGQHAIFLFDEDTQKEVIPGFAAYVVEQCPDWRSRAFDARVVASGIRHQSEGLRAYFDDYLPPAKQRAEVTSLIGCLRCAADTTISDASLAQRLQGYSDGLIDVLRRLNHTPGDGLRWSRARLWAGLAAVDPDAPLRLRGVLVDCLRGRVDLSEEAAWRATAEAICSNLSLLTEASAADIAVGAGDFLHFSDPAEVLPDTGTDVFVHQVCAEAELVLRLGSIASVKGQTHDATLVVQSKAHTTRDLVNAFSVAFGGKPPPTEANAGKLKAVMNVFVAATRPSHLLCLAIPATQFKVKKHRQKAANDGWRIVDLTAR